MAGLPGQPGTQNVEEQQVKQRGKDGVGSGALLLQFLAKEIDCGAQSWMTSDGRWQVDQLG
jgi:hypothetical protein